MAAEKLRVVGFAGCRHAAVGPTKGAPNGRVPAECPVCGKVSVTVQNFTVTRVEKWRPEKL